MTEKRYYEKQYGDEFYILDSEIISEKDLDKELELSGYTALSDSLTGREIIELLNENKQLKQQYIDEFSLRETLQLELQRVENENYNLKKRLKHLEYRFTEYRNKELK